MRQVVRRCIRAADQLALAMAVLAAAALAGIVLLLLAEIVVRSWFDATTGVSWELGVYLMAATVFLGAGWTLRTGGHVRVGLAFEALTPARRRWLDLAASLAGLPIVVLVAVALGDLAWISFARDVRSWYPTQTPLGIPQAAVALGAWVLAIQLAARIGALVLGDAPELAAPDDDRPGTEA